MKIRDENDPEGMFLGEWHYRVLPLEAKALSEREKGRAWMGKGFGDALEWFGGRADPSVGSEGEKGPLEQVLKEGNVRNLNGMGDMETDSPSPPATATSEESFDYLAKGEASMHE